MTEPDPEPDPLSAEDREALARMKPFLAEAKKDPRFGTIPVADPDRFAGPIGADGDGNIITYRSIDDVPPKQPLKIKDADEPAPGDKPGPRHRA